MFKLSMVNILKKLEGFKGMAVWHAAQQYIFSMGYSSQMVSIIQL